MPGFQIGSSCEGLNLDSPELDPIYKTCEELGAVSERSLEEGFDAALTRPQEHATPMGIY